MNRPWLSGTVNVHHAKRTNGPWRYIPAGQKDNAVPHGQFRGTDLYPFVRDLLTNAAFGIGLKSDQVVVDSALAGARRQGRHPFREATELVGFILRNGSSQAEKAMVPYSIQWMMRLKPTWFRHDLLTLLDLLKQSKIKPLIAQRLPLEGARRAHEMLGEGGVLGKIVLLPNG
jgi:hypothetical protein